MILEFNGQGYVIPDEWAEKIKKFDKIKQILEESDPYHNNRGTCNRIRELVEDKR